tara:strand:- start:2262 stop:2588 length:327 start_codon:yes stop_codon:yes gene_type:complete
MSLAKYLFYLFENTNYMEEFKDNYTIHKKTNNILIQPSIFLKKYTEYLNKHYTDINAPTYRDLKLAFTRYGIFLKAFKVKGKSPTNFYIFNDFDIITIINILHKSVCM